MPSLPSFPCYHQRWLADTAHLSLAAQGLYWRFLCWSWANGPLPNSLQQLRQLSGVGMHAFKPLWRETRSQWRRSKSGFLNPRLEIIRAESSQFQETQKAKANKRWRHAAASPAAMPVDMPGACLPISDLRSPISKDQEHTIRARANDPMGGPDTLLNGRELRRHGTHAWCSDRICVPFQLHEDLRKQGLKSSAEMKDFYTRTVEALNGQPFGDDAYTFWRNAFAGWVGTVSAKPTGKRSFGGDAGMSARVAARFTKGTP